MIEVRLATLEDAKYIANNLRKCDLQEAIASAGEDFEGAVIASFQASALCWVASEDSGVPLMIFGVAPADHAPGVGVPWMLATDGLKEHHREFIKRTKWYVELMNHMYPLLYNFVDKRNTATKRWLRWSGFTLGEDFPEYGVGKVPFTLFYRKRNV